MTLDQYANLFNLSQDAGVLFFAMVVFNRYPSRFFRIWTLGYGLGVVLAGLELWASFIGHPLSLTLAQGLCIAASAWLFVQAGCLMYERELPTSSLFASLAVIFAWELSTFGRAPYHVVALVPVLALMGSHWWLGGAFLRRLGRPDSHVTAWFGFPLILSGCWFLAYPLLVDSPFHWTGPWVAGLLNLCIGVGILIYLLEGTGNRLRDKNQTLTTAEIALQQTQNELLLRNHELATEKKLIERIVESVPAGIVYLDPSLRIQWINPVITHYLQTSADQLVGRPIHEALPLLENPAPRFAEALRQQEPMQVTGLVHNRLDNGQRLYLEATYMPVYDDAQRLEGLMLVVTDVTARHENERLQADKIAQLKEVDRLKGDFINAASHELRTPLTSIRGYAEFLEDAVAGPINLQQLAYVQQIQAGTERLQRIVDDMLDFARLEAGTFQLVPRGSDLAEVVRTEVASLAPQATNAQVSLEVRLPEAPLAAHFDPQRIGQVLLNLIGNALKFTPQGGRITVTAKRLGEHVQVAVTDTGIGIAEENLPHLFSKFYQVNPSLTREHGGAGLGLSITKALVEAHRGELGVESTPGLGSTFWFTLPALAPGAGDPVLET